MGSSLKESGRHRPRAVAAVFLMLFGAFLPALPTASAAALVDNTPLLDSLDGGNPRDDHTFTGATGTWSVAGTLLYEQAGNSGDFRAELRQGSPAGAVLAYDPLGNYFMRAPLSVLAVDGWNLPASDTFYVSEILNNVAPSYAVEFEGSPVAIFGSPFTDVSSMGANGVIQTYQIFLNKRDTIDVSLSVPPTYTYNYNLQLYLFGGAPSLYYSATASVSPGPAAVSGGPMNTDQFIRYIAPVDAWYVLVIGNTKELANVPYTLTVHTNGRTLGDTAPSSGTVHNFNTNDDYAFANAASDWAFVAVRTDDPGYGKWLTAELHTPTFDSNVLAAESPTTGASRAGVLAVNRFEPGTPNTSLVTVRWGPFPVFPVSYTLEMDNRVPVLSSNETPRRFDFSAGEILRGATVALLRGETLELHADVDPFFTYPYELQLIVFAPGSSFYAASGPAQEGPVAAAREGANTGKDLTFTAPADGFYGIAILSLNSTYAVPIDVTVIVQGRPLQHNDVRFGGLEDGNPKDLFTVNVDTDRWGIVAGEMVGGSGSYVQHVAAGGFDAIPVASDPVGTSPGMPLFALEAINNYGRPQQDYFVTVARTAGAPSYMVEFDSAPLSLARNSRTNVTVPDGQLVSGYEINLNAGETVDFRLLVDSGFSYPYALQLFVFSPLAPYYSLSGTGAGGGVASLGGANSEQDIVVVAPVTGSYLVVVANLGSLNAVPAALDIRINGEPIGPGVFGVGDLTAANRLNYYSFDARAAAWTVAGVKIGASTSPADTLVHTLHGPTPDSLALATDRVRGAGGEGLIVVDGFSLQTTTPYYLSESASLAGENSLTYQVQITNNFPVLQAASQVVTGTLPPSSQFVGYTIQLTQGQTLDLRLRRAEGFSYPYNLGLFVFRPGSGNASSSGEDGGAPMTASSNGPSIEQDGIFTATGSGTHLILVANLDVPREVNYTLNVTLDGWELLDDTHLEGDLNIYNRADQYRFQAASGAWSVAGVKWTGGTGAVRAGLHTLGLNTLPLATVDADAAFPVALLPFFAPQNASNASTTFFLNVTLSPAPGAPTGEYAVDFSGSPALWDNAEIGNTHSYTVPGSGFFSLHALDLRQGDWVDIRVRVNATYTKQNDLNLALYGIPLAPKVLQVAPLATSRNAPNLEESMSFFANESGSYLLVVENAGNPDSVPYTLSISRHTVVGSPPKPVQLTLTAGRDYIEATWTQSDETDFAFYQVWVATTDDCGAGNLADEITIAQLTYARIEGPNIQPGQTYYMCVIVWDTEGRGAPSAVIGVKTEAKNWWEESIFQLAAIAGVAVVIVVIFAYGRAKGVRSGKPFRLRSSKAEGVVEERKGPKGKPRAPKEEAALAAAVPGAPPRQTQEAVDYMQRVMKGGR